MRQWIRNLMVNQAYIALFVAIDLIYIHLYPVLVGGTIIGIELSIFKHALSNMHQPEKPRHQSEGTGTWKPTRAELKEFLVLNAIIIMLLIAVYFTLNWGLAALLGAGLVIIDVITLHQLPSERTRIDSIKPGLDAQDKEIKAVEEEFGIRQRKAYAIVAAFIIGCFAIIALSVYAIVWFGFFIMPSTFGEQGATTCSFMAGTCPTGNWLMMLAMIGGGFPGFTFLFFGLLGAVPGTRRVSDALRVIYGIGDVLKRHEPSSG